MPYVAIILHPSITSHVDNICDHHTIYDDHLPPLMYCTDAISLHAAYDPPCAYAGGEEDGRLLPYSLHTSLPI
jgi:hypothetical protein